MKNNLKKKRKGLEGWKLEEKGRKGAKENKDNRQRTYIIGITGNI